MGGGVFLGKLHRMRIGPAQPVGVGIIDVNRNPLPAFRLLHLRGDPFQLFDDKPVQQRGVFVEAAAILREQVADDVAACFGVGFRADEDRAPIRRRNMRSHEVAADEGRIAVIGQVFVNLFLPRMVLGDGEGHQLVQRQAAIAIDLHQFGADRAKP
jgi:hypothetical protein